LILASEVRSGSTFIAESIAYHFETAIGGVLFDLTKEHFAFVEERSSKDDILAAYNSLFLGKGGWVATKIMCAALSVLVREARKSDAVRDAFFGRSAYWIIVRRRAKVRQAVSLAFARKTGVWHSYSEEEGSGGSSEISFRDTEDALRSVLISDTYLEAFRDAIAADRRTEVIYEDFLVDPKPLIDHLYDVLEVGRPEGGSRYVDRTKIRRSAADRKRKAEGDFKIWLLENFHRVEEVGTAASSTRKDASAFKLRIVEDFLKRRQSIALLAKRHGIERSLISFWIAKYRHGELGAEVELRDEVARYKDKIIALENELAALRARLAAPSSSARAPGKDLG